jgi:iron only hydrogenase large subunit-like protein
VKVLPSLLAPMKVPEGFVALVSPSIRESFSSAALRLNGFLAAEGARGARPVDAGIGEFAALSAEAIAARGPGLHVLSACPMARRFLELEFPELAGRVLGTPSPMALMARRALAEEGAGRPAFCVAVTPCRYKVLEASPAGERFKVIPLAALLKAARDLDVDPFGFPAIPYEGSVPAEGSCSRIAEAVAEELAARSVPAKAVKLDGIDRARDYLRAPDQTGSGAALVVELSFCEGGCSPDRAGIAL